jgi:integrase
MSYGAVKGLDAPKVSKADEEKFLTPGQVVDLLTAVHGSAAREMRRDHAVIYLGFYLALRVGEAAMLSREQFRDLHRGIVYVRTLKSSPRAKVSCSCGRRYTVSAARSEYPCPRCGNVNPVKFKGKQADLFPEKRLPFLEDSVQRYLRGYLDGLPKNQRWLFPGPGEDTHLSESQVQRIFASYLGFAGLPLIYSYHALRHGRGMQLWDKYHDLVLIKDFLRHRSFSPAQWYAHISPERRKAYASDLDKESIQFRKGPTDE